MSGNVLSGAVLPDPTKTTVSLATPPANGTVTLNADGSYTYTPHSGFSGTDSSYQLSDGAGSSTATVNIAVQANEVMTTDSNYSMDLAGGSLTVAAPGVLAGDSTDSPSLTARLDTSPTNGTLALNADGSFTYTPNANFVGTDSFTYDAVMADGQSQTATVSVDVTKQAPVAADGGGSGSAGAAMTASVASLLAGASDRGGTIDPNSFTIVANPHHGTVAVQSGPNGGSVVYTPDAGFSGQDWYYYTVSDSTGQTSNAAKVTVTVAPADTISIGNVAASGPQDTPLTIDVLANVTINGQPAEGMTGVTVATAGAPPLYGSASVDGNNDLVYTPGASWAGTDAITFTVTDAAGTTVQGTANVLIVAVDPLGNNADSVGGGSAGSGGSSGASGGGSGSSPPGSAGSGDPGTSGGASGSGGASSGGGNSGTTGGSMLSEPPLTVDVSENTTAGISLPTLWPYVEVTSPPGDGTVANYENGGFNYTSQANFTGSDSFTYVAYDNSWNAISGTVTLNVTPGAVVPDAQKPTKGPLTIQPTEGYTPVPTDPYELSQPEWQSSVIVYSDQTFTSYLTGVVVANISDGPIAVSFGAHSASFKPYGEVGAKYTVDVSGVSGYADATWTGPDVQFLKITASGNISGVDLPNTDIWFNAGIAIGNVIANDAYEWSNYGVGKVTAMNDAAIDTYGGADLGVTAKNDVGYVLASGDIGPVDAKQGAIGVIDAGGDLTGKIHAVGDIGSVWGFSLKSDVTSDSGSIGFGDSPDWTQALMSLDPAYYNGVQIVTDLSGSIEAAAGNIELVCANTISSPAIEADGRIDMVAAGLSISASQITSNHGTIYSVAAGRGGISNASIYAHDDIGGNAPDTFSTSFLPLGYVGVADGVGSAGPISGCTISAAVAQQDAGNSPLPPDPQAGAPGQGEGGSNSDGSSTGTGNIDTVSGLDISGTKINAAGNIQLVAAGNSIAGTIKAGGDIGQICTSPFGNWGYAEGLAQDVSANITAGGDITAVYVGRDLTGTIKAVNLPSVRVDRNLTGTITATGDIGTVTVQRSVSQPISGNTIGKVLVGYDLSANVTSNQAIAGVGVGHTLSGNITAKAGGIQVVAVGNVLTCTPSVFGEYWTFAQPAPNLIQGSIQGSTIKATGDIGWISVISGPGYGGDITGATISAEDIGTVLASGNLGATITATGSIGSVSAGSTMLPGLVAFNGGDLTGSIKTGTSIGVVTANGTPFTPGVGSIEATITAGTDIAGLSASIDISGAANAGHSILSGATAGRDISGALTATSGAIGAISAGRDVTGDVTAGQSIGNVTAGGNIGSETGGISAGGNLGNVTAGTGPAGGGIFGNISAGGSIGNVFAGGSADEKNISTGDTPAGLIGTGPQWYLTDDGSGGYTVDKPEGEEAPDGGGNISGTIHAGLTLGSVTAYGTISKKIDSGQGMGSVWTLGDISGDIAPGAGPLQVDSWGTISGDLSAPSTITVSSFGDLSGDVTSTSSSIGIKTWGAMSGTLEAPNVVNVWALGDVSGEVASNESQVKILCYATVSSTVNTYDGYFVDAYALDGASLVAEALGPGVLADGGFDEDQVVVVADIVNSKMTVDESGQGSNPVVPGVAPTLYNFMTAFELGWEYVYSGGDITGSDIEAGIGADVVAEANISATTIDTSLAGAMPSSWWGGSAGVQGSVQPGWVNLMSKGSCDATVDAYTTLTVNCTSMSGSYSANGAVGIQAWGNATGQITAGGDIQMFVHGSLSGQITSQDGTAVIGTSGDVSASVKGTAVGLYTLGSFTGNATSTNGAIDIGAFGGVTGGQIKSAWQVDVTTWGDMSDSIEAGGYASVYAYGDSSGNVTADGDVAMVTFGDETGDLTANGDDPTVAVLANGNVGGTIESPTDVSIVSGADVTANITAEDGDVTITSTGEVDTPDILAGGSINVTAAGEVSLENATAKEGSINAWSGGDLTLEGFAATSIGTFASKTSTVTAELSSSGGSVSVISLEDATVTVNADAAGVSITSGGKATVNLAGSTDEQGKTGSIKTVSVTCSGNLTGSVSATDDVELTAFGSASGLTVTTSSPTSQLNVVASGGLNAMLTSGNELTATSLGQIEGTYQSGTATGFTDGSATINGKGAVDATVTSAGDANVNSNENIDGGIIAQDDANVIASQSVGASVVATDDANVTSIQGDVSGSVQAGDDASAMAARSVANVKATQDATVVAGSDSSGNVTAQLGDADVTVLGEFNGTTSAGDDANVYAQLVSGTVTAGADANVLSASDVSSTVTAGDDATVTAVQTVSADVTAADDATVFGGTQVNAVVTAIAGSADVTSGGALPKAVTAGLDASVFALGDVSADIQAGRDISLVGWQDVTGDLNASGSVSAAAYSDLSSQVTAGQDASLLVVGNLSAPVQAGGDAAATVGGNETGAITAGGEADVAARGSLGGTITADAGDANVYALGDITGNVSAGGSASVATWGTLSDNVTAAQDASAWSGGNMQVNITATNGDASADSSNTGKITLVAGGDGEVSAADALTANMTTGGDADLFSYGTALVGIQAGGDATLTTGGWLAGSVKTPTGSIDALSFGEVSGEYDAGWDASVITSQDIATATITAGDDASAIAWAGAAGLDVEGTNDAYAFAYGGMGGTVESSAGPSEAFSGGGAVVTLNAATTATFNGLGDAQLQVNSGGDADVFAAGLLAGSITAGQDVYALSYGLFKANVNASRDANVASVGDMQSSVAAGRDLWALSFGNLDAEPFTAGNDVVFVGAVGDITGSIHAEDDIHQIATYGTIDGATISAGSPLPPGEGQGEGGSDPSGSGSIALIEAYGNISGSITATSDIDLVQSAHDITATITAPTVGTIDKFDPLVMSGQPSLPDTSLADVWATLADDDAAVLNVQADLAAGALMDALALGAARLAADDEFQVSMGSPKEAQAAIQQAVAQLSGSIAQLADGINQALAGAWVGQQTAWAELTAGITASQAAFTSDLGRAATEANEIKGTLFDAVVESVFAQTEAYWGEVDLRRQTLADRDNYLANGRNADFDKIVAQLDARWWKGTFFVGGDVGASNSAGPWYNNDWTDWVNPFAWIASTAYGIKDALVGGYQFLTKDHAAEWAAYRDGKAERLTRLSMTGDVAAYQQAERQALGQQARNVINDAATWANAYTTGLQLIGSAPGMIRAATGFIEGEFLNCTLLQKACFAAGTPVLTPQGPRPIETLVASDQLLCRAEDDPTGQVQIGMIDGIAVLTAQIWEVYVGGRCIETTAEHPFYLVGKTPGEISGWTPVNRLREGDLLLGNGAVPMAVERVVQTDRTATVYSLRVEPHHTFFVGDEEWCFSLWVHNAPCLPISRYVARPLGGGLMHGGTWHNT